MYICNNQSSPHLVLFSIIVLFFQFVHGINSDEIDFYPKAGEPHKQKNRRVRYKRPFSSHFILDYDISDQFF